MYTTGPVAGFGEAASENNDRSYRWLFESEVSNWIERRIGNQLGLLPAGHKHSVGFGAIKRLNNATLLVLPFDAVDFPFPIINIRFIDSNCYLEKESNNN